MSNKKTGSGMEPVNCRGSKSASIEELIVVETTVGNGTEENPLRIITEFWSKEGELRAISDPHITAIGQLTSLD